MTARLARGSLPWPALPTLGPTAARPVCRGSITVEEPIAPGARLRITAWPRSGPNGELWLSLELTDYPPGGRATRDNPRTPQQPKESVETTERGGTAQTEECD